MRFLTSCDSSRARDNNRGEIESTMKGLVQVTWEDNEFLANLLHSEDITSPYHGFLWLFPTSFKRYLEHGMHAKHNNPLFVIEPAEDSANDDTSMMACAVFIGR